MELSNEDKSYIRDLRKFTELIESIREQESIDDYYFYLRENHREEFIKLETEVNRHELRFKDSSSLPNRMFLGIMELIADGKLILKE